MGERESGDKTVADCVHENTIRRHWLRLHRVGINLRLPVRVRIPALFSNSSDCNQFVAFVQFPSGYACKDASGRTSECDFSETWATKLSFLTLHSSGLPSPTLGGNGLWQQCSRNNAMQNHDRPQQNAVEASGDANPTKQGSHTDIKNKKTYNAAT